MADAVRAMAQEFARDPDSLVFLRLGEQLRHRGDLEAAESVALAGLDRYPDLPEARDLYARVLVDRGHPAEARQVWESILAVEGRYPGAHKGLGFLAYAEGDLDAALDHLETALAADPAEPGVIEALRIVRTTVEEAEAEQVVPAVFERLDATEAGMLLIDRRGRVLGGTLQRDGRSVADEVAAYLTGVTQEAVRAARLLRLGRWEWLIAEGELDNLHVTAPTEDTRLLVMRERSIPPGRLAFLAAKAHDAAREWLEAQRP